VLAAPITQIQRLTCYSLNRMEKLAANALTTIAIILVFLTRIMAIVVQSICLGRLAKINILIKILVVKALGLLVLLDLNKSDLLL
jgi:hypothetical protein